MMEKRALSKTVLHRTRTVVPIKGATMAEVTMVAGARIIPVSSIPFVRFSPSVPLSPISRPFSRCP